jgi:hypothetical protein
MMENAADFGTGLRAHLGLEHADLELLPGLELTAGQADALPELDDDLADDLAAAAATDSAALEALASLEAELLERERVLTLREASLASRAGSVLAAAQALYDEVLGGGPAPEDDELASLRRRRRASIA